jgi:hypothetical protein
MGMDPDAFSLGEVHTTLYASSAGEATLVTEKVSINIVRLKTLLMDMARAALQSGCGIHAFAGCNTTSGRMVSS